MKTQRRVVTCNILSFRAAFCRTRFPERINGGFCSSLNRAIKLNVNSQSSLLNFYDESRDIRYTRIGIEHAFIEKSKGEWEKAM